MFSYKRTSPSLLVTLGGNVGNQLFQLAGALTLVNGDVSRLLLDERFTYLYNGPQLHKIVHFTPLPVARKRDLIRYGLWPFDCVKSARVHHCFQKIAQLSGLVKTYYSEPTDNQLAAEQYSIDSGNSAQVMGYFQHMKWVERSSKHLLPRFASWQTKSGSRNLGVSIRRRADYSGNRLHSNYYNDCINHLLARKVQLDTIVVTGDTEGQSDLIFYPGATIQYVNKCPWSEQFASLSTCDFSILSNSTFAWWAAWIAHNQRAHKSRTLPHTYYPAHWFDTSLTDLEGWISIEKGDLW